MENNSIVKKDDQRSDPERDVAAHGSPFSIVLRLKLPGPNAVPRDQHGSAPATEIAPNLRH